MKTATDYLSERAAADDLGHLVSPSDLDTAAFWMREILYDNCHFQNMGPFIPGGDDRIDFMNDRATWEYRTKALDMAYKILVTEIAYGAVVLA